MSKHGSILKWSFRRTWIRNLVICQFELRVIQIDTILFLQLSLNFLPLFLEFSLETLVNYVGWYTFHAVDVDVYSIAARNRVRHLAYTCSMELVVVGAK